MTNIATEDLEVGCRIYILETIKENSTKVLLESRIIFNLNSNSIEYKREHTLDSLEAYDRQHYSSFIKDGCIDFLKDLQSNPYKFLKTDSFKEISTKIIKEEISIKKISIAINIGSNIKGAMESLYEVIEL